MRAQSWARVMGMFERNTSLLFQYVALGKARNLAVYHAFRLRDGTRKRRRTSAQLIHARFGLLSRVMKTEPSDALV